MSWRYQPPVLSPVGPRTLFAGIAAVSGFAPSTRAAVRAQLCNRFDAIDCLLTDSGTSALVLAMRALAPSGGVVALPGYACIDLTAAAVKAGVTVRLYDLDPATLAPDLDSLRAALARGVDAVVIAHLYGYPADMQAVRALAAEHGVPIIEDAAQGAGGTLGGVRLGSFGDLVVLSFGRGKGLSGGSGGALLARTPALAEALDAMEGRLAPAMRGERDLVTLGAQWVLGRPSLYRLPASVPALALGEMVYHPAGEPAAIATTAVGVLAAALRLDEGEVRARRARAATLLAAVESSPSFAAIAPVPDGIPGYLRVAVMDVRGGRRPAPHLGAVRGYPLTLEQHEPLRPILAGGERAGKGAEALRDTLFTLPAHSRVSEADVRRLRDWLGEGDGSGD